MALARIRIFVERSSKVIKAGDFGVSMGFLLVPCNLQWHWPEAKLLLPETSWDDARCVFRKMEFPDRAPGCGR